MDFFEMSSRNSKGGRRKIKMSLLEIHQDENATNKNGIHWKEEYVLNNLESVKGMPICAEFLDDDKSAPYGHGLTGIDTKENQPLFENSECVGCIETAYPTTVEINGVNKRILCAEGYIYQQRYPHFVEWLKENMKTGNVMSSVEIMGKAENENKIIYEDNEVAQEYRVPQIYDFSATAILSGAVEAADDTALLLQMNSLNKSSDDFSKTKGKEEKDMDKEMLAQVVESVKTAISETNSKNAEYETQISELNATVAEKETQIVELNATVEQVQKALDDLKKEQETYWAEREELEKELGKLKAQQRLNELNSALAEFSDEQKAFAQAEIDAFNADPMAVEINSITTKIFTEIGKKAQADAKAAEEQKLAEINSKKDEPVDIYGEVLEINSSNDTEEQISIY